jgi:hypothetical protein
MILNLILAFFLALGVLCVWGFMVLGLCVVAVFGALR